MAKKIIIAGGGTGGHIFPAVAIANALRRIEPDMEILFVGAKGKMEMEKVPQAGYRVRGLDIAGFNRSSLLKNLTLPFKIIRSFAQVSRIFRSFGPDAVIGVGGYSTFPVLRYAQSKQIPTFIHEANSFAGKANIMLGKKATKIFVAGDGMERFFRKQKLMVTGNPIRKSIAADRTSREEGVEHFGLRADQPVVLITGGSLGARSVNEAIAASLGSLRAENIQLIWQTGKAYASEAAKLAQNDAGIWTGEFIGKMEMAFAAADVVVSRSGAMAIAELSVVRKPSVFVPYPFAAEDHQTENARRMMEKGAALMIPDKDAKDRLAGEIIGLVKNEAKRSELASNIAKFAVTDADETVAAEILKIING